MCVSDVIESSDDLVMLVMLGQALVMGQVMLVMGHATFGHVRGAQHARMPRLSARRAC